MKSLMATFACLFFFVICIYILPLSGKADVIYVDDDADSGGDGSSWNNAYKYLQDALDTTTAGDTILVAQGTYYPDTAALADTRTATFQLISGVELYGGYIGSGDTRDIELYPTILSGNIGTQGDTTDNSYHVVTAINTDETAVLDGFMITAGNADGSIPDHQGGGMYNNSGNPVLTDCTFISNSAVWYGGGLYNNSGSPILTDCTFINNSAVWYGGGLYNNSGSPTLTNCSFSGNLADQVGGGLYNNSGSPALTDCTFSGNTGYSLGGGMYNNSGNPVLTDCTFTDNTASLWNGGGLYNNSGSPALTDCTFISNSADRGGGMHNEQGSPKIIDCAFSGNKASDRGGGMYNAVASSTLTNCSFSGNTAYNYGGGMFNRGNPTLLNCAFSGNTAGNNGGGMYCSDQRNAMLLNCTFSGNKAGNMGGGIYNSIISTTLTNCILWGNTDSGGMDESAQVHVVWSGTPVVTFSCIQDDDPNDTYVPFDGAGGNIDDNPQLVGDPIDTGSWSADALYDSGTTFRSTLTDTGASWAVDSLAGMFIRPDTTTALKYLVVSNSDTTVTIWSDVSDSVQTGDNYEIYDYHLRAGSPCIDAGYMFTNAGEYDLDRNQRYLDSSDSSGWDGRIKGIDVDNEDTVHLAWKLIDMGAYEYQPSVTLCDTFTLQSRDALDTDSWQDVYTGKTGTWADTQTIGVKQRFYRVWGEYLLRIISITRNDNDIVLHWNTLPGITYYVQWSEDLANWNETLAGIVNFWTHINGALNQRMFYRIRQE